MTIKCKSKPPTKQQVFGTTLQYLVYGVADVGFCVGTVTLSGGTFGWAACAGLIAVELGATELQHPNNLHAFLHFCHTVTGQAYEKAKPHAEAAAHGLAGHAAKAHAAITKAAAPKAAAAVTTSFVQLQTLPAGFNKDSATIAKACEHVRNGKTLPENHESGLSPKEFTVRLLKRSLGRGDNLHVAEGDRDKARKR